VPDKPALAFTVLAHQGPLTRTVTDTALMLSVIGQLDTRDTTAWNTPAPDFRIGLDDGVRSLRIAWSPRLGYVKELNSDVEMEARKAAQVFADLGAHVEEADPGFAEPIDIEKIVWYAVAATLVDAVPSGERDKMDEGLRRTAEQGLRYSLADYLTAHTRRTELAQHMLRFHERYDLLLTPQMPVPAIEAGRVTLADGRFGNEWINWSPDTYLFNPSSRRPRCPADFRRTGCRSPCRSSARRAVTRLFCARPAPMKTPARLRGSSHRDGASK